MIQNQVFTTKYRFDGSLQFSPSPPEGTGDTPPQSPQQRIRNVLHQQPLSGCLSPHPKTHTNVCASCAFIQTPHRFCMTLDLAWKPIGNEKLGMCVIEMLWCHWNLVNWMNPVPLYPSTHLHERHSVLNRPVCVRVRRLNLQFWNVPFCTCVYVCVLWERLHQEIELSAWRTIQKTLLPPQEQ